MKIYQALSFILLVYMNTSNAQAINQYKGTLIDAHSQIRYDQTAKRLWSLPVDCQ